MKKISMIVLAGILLLTPSCDFMKSINPFGKKAREAEALRQQQEAFRVADSIRVANEKQAEAERARQAELARIAEQEAIELSNYHVIVGSFLTPSSQRGFLSLRIPGSCAAATLEIPVSTSGSNRCRRAVSFLGHASCQI